MWNQWLSAGCPHSISASTTVIRSRVTSFILCNPLFPPLRLKVQWFGQRELSVVPDWVGCGGCSLLIAMHICLCGVVPGHSDVPSPAACQQEECPGVAGGSHCPHTRCAHAGGEASSRLPGTGCHWNTCTAVWVLQTPLSLIPQDLLNCFREPTLLYRIFELVFCLPGCVIICSEYCKIPNYLLPVWLWHLKLNYLGEVWRQWGGKEDVGKYLVIQIW